MVNFNNSKHDLDQVLKYISEEKNSCPIDEQGNPLMDQKKVVLTGIKVPFEDIFFMVLKISLALIPVTCIIFFIYYLTSTLCEEGFNNIFF